MAGKVEKKPLSFKVVEPAAGQVDVAPTAVESEEAGQKAVKKAGKGAELKQTGVRIPVEQYRQIRVLAFERDVPMQDLIGVAIAEWLERQNKKG